MEIKNFFPSVLFVSGAIFAPAGAKCRTLCRPPVGGLHVFGVPLLMDQFVRGLSESSSLPGTSIGSNSVCPLVRIEEEVSSYYCLLQQAVADSWGDDASMSLATCLIRKETNPNFEAPHMLMSCGCLCHFTGATCWFFCTYSNTSTVMADCYKRS